MNNVEEIDLKQLLALLRDKIRFIILAVLLGGILAFTICYWCVVPMYTASVSLYVNNARNPESVTTNTNDISASQMLVNTYIEMINSNSVLTKVAAATGLDYTIDDIRSMMSAQAKNNTEIFEVSIRCANPKHAQIIANAVAQVAPDAILDYVEASSVKVIDYAGLPTVPTSPNVKRDTAIGLLLGLIMSILWVILRQLLDVRIKSEDDLINLFHLPVLGAIPDMNKVYDSTKYQYQRKEGLAE